MEGPIVANECAASNTEKPEAAEKKENVGSSSKNQRKLLDSTYSAAAKGEITRFREHSHSLDQILTPNGNTILHIHITARLRRKLNQERTLDLEDNDFVRNMLRMCPALLRKVNKKDETLLHMAARHGHADVAKFLLDECNQNYDQEHGITAREMLQMKNEIKDTALHEAVRYNHLDVVKILTKEDPTSPYDANTDGETPLYLAAERGHVGVLKEILGTCISPADGGPYGRTALHMAVFQNDEEMTSLLSAKEGICVSKLQDIQGWTPLHFAAYFGHTEILKQLLAKDKDAAYAVDRDKKTALHVAAEQGEVEIMQELLSTCPGCYELVDIRGWNVLHFAWTSCSNNEAIRLVLRDPSLRNLVNEKNKDGNTPFLQAVSMGCPSDMLLSAQTSTEVDKLVFNKDNHNAADLHYAKIKSRIRRDDIILPNLYTLLFHKNKVAEGARTGISKTDNGKSKSQEGEANEEVNTTSSKSENGIATRVGNDLKKVVENNLLADTLIATVSFAAGITIPGGFITDKGPHQGTAVLTGTKAFRAFIVLNTMSLFLSSLAVFFHVFNLVTPWDTVKHFIGMLVSKHLTTLAMVAMMGAFLSGTWAVLQEPDKYLAIISSSIVVGFFLILAAGYSLLLKVPSTLFDKMFTTNHPLMEKILLCTISSVPYE